MTWGAGSWTVVGNESRWCTRRHHPWHRFAFRSKNQRYSLVATYLLASARCLQLSANV